ncbi:hypothetical protein SNOG_07348 [Parastagonospora nodorum SN15]|uniref:Uncharacterized protein n=1 Tax=Phaeosphaeria nodorum (strain SN15 / ATCC MYA-4574 / FGSC 10173) TaxID=321614 RepID=Q0ULL6_PHANO|nr:hypothetical protein SNOG_07348 [Parastagonospora nodorum SN15]EAT84814.1 hypothetical protein SNOG_07348 [Parastagonospora nodorum SN15]
MAHGGVTDDGEGPFTPARRKRHPPLCWSKPSRTPAESERRPAGRVWLRYVPSASANSVPARSSPEACSRAIPTSSLIPIQILPKLGQTLSPG